MTNPVTRRRQQRDRLLSALTERQARGDTTTTRDLAAEVGMSYYTACDLLTLMVSQGWVERVRDGRRRVLRLPGHDGEVPSLTDGGVPACGCGKAIGWTRYIRGRTDCEACAINDRSGGDGR